MSTLKGLIAVMASVFAFLAIFPTTTFAQTSGPATTPIFSTGGPGGAEHRVPHDIAFSATPSVSDRTAASTTITNWVNAPMTRLVCVEAFNTSTSARTHLGCVLVNFNADGTPIANANINVPLTSLTTGTYRIVYSYQDSAGFWHQMTNLNDRLVNITATIQ